MRADLIITDARDDPTSGTIGLLHGNNDGSSHVLEALLIRKPQSECGITHNVQAVQEKKRTCSRVV